MDSEPKTRLLLVEDDHVDAMLFKRACRWLPVDLRWVQTVAEAVSVSENEKFAIAFVDLNLPGENGVEFMRWAQEHCPDLHLIAISTSDWDVDVKRARAAGCSQYLVKGLGKQFQETIRATCRRWMPQ